MWIPKSEEEILAAIESGDLSETAIFDAKMALPARGRSKDLAIDVAAMANDGGTLLYGVGEDEHGRPTVSNPFELAGAAERVDQIVRTCISEPPTIEVQPIPTEASPGMGYLVVAVPPSPRAPHMVTVGEDHRYYGRSATGNERLTEGEVARLYERRRRWEIDREALLDEAIARAPIEAHDNFSYLHLVARPVVPDESLLDRAKGDQNVVQFLNTLFAAAISDEVFPSSYGKGYSPDLADSNTFDRRADGWATSRGLGEDWQRYEDPGYVLDFEIHLDGGGRLFCGRAAQRYDDLGLLLSENLVAGLTARFLRVLGGLYAAGAYLGPVDVGLAVTGLEGALSFKLSQNLTSRFFLQPYDRTEYRRTERFLASILRDDPRSAAKKLVLPLTRAVTREQYDPFSE
jgi:hypothetical protein